jgi:hypothetical protein
MYLLSKSEISHKHSTFSIGPKHLTHGNTGLLCGKRVCLIYVMPVYTVHNDANLKTTVYIFFVPLVLIHLSHTQIIIAAFGEAPKYETTSVLVGHL